MTSATRTTQTVQVYRVYIKATPQAVWDAIVSPEWSERYGYGSKADYDLRPGGSYRAYPNDAMIAFHVEQGWPPLPDVIVDGEVIECDPPHKLVQTWRLLMDPTIAEEGFTRLTYEIEERGNATMLTVTHDVEGAPALAELLAGRREREGAGGGWAWVLSDLKSLLETGKRLAD
jgi:uncharacterized protein YndB with AHSA1/START domain